MILNYRKPSNNLMIATAPDEWPITYFLVFSSLPSFYLINGIQNFSLA
jgi:hypothetical protein